MQELNFENFDSLKSDKFVEFCSKLYNCFINNDNKYFFQETLDNFFREQKIPFEGKYSTLIYEEKLFEKGYNKNIISLLNVFFNLYKKNLHVFILNEDSLIEIIPGKKVNQKRMTKKILKMKQKKIREIITSEMTPDRLQR